MNTSKHTPTPWEVRGELEIYGNEQNGYICTCSGRSANAEFIVRACNCHDKLVKALETLVKHADSMNNRQHAGIDLLPEDWSDLFRFCNIAREALTKAKGGK